MNSTKTGREGEEVAKKYLESEGYTIIEQNYRTKRAEIDIVAWHKNILVFVEVRTKRHEQYGTPEESIDWRKRMKLQRNAMAYIHWEKYKGQYRIDAVCLVMSAKGIQRVAHYENINV